MAKDTDFLYISARIKFLETKLLGRSVIERLLDTPSPDEALKVLGDTEYGNDIAEMENIYDFEKILEQSMSRTINTLKESFTNHEIIHFFTAKNDFHNLKVIVKGDILGEEFKQHFSMLGEVSTEEIKKYVSGDTGASIPDNLKTAYHLAIKQYQKTQDPQQVDFVIDQALFREMANIVEITKDPFLGEYLGALADLTNIKTFVRLKKIGVDIKTVDSALVVGGDLTGEFFKELFAENTQALVDALGPTLYHQVVEEGISQWESTGSPSIFEKLIDNYMIALARKALYKPFGPETVVGYMAARENELKILRIIMVGKINGISSDMIRERLRDVYV